MKIAVEVDYEVSPEELAVAFCQMTSDEQAEFFNTIAREARGWNAPFAYQLQAITDEDTLSCEARYIMHQIGQYSPVGAKSENFSLLAEHKHEPGSWP